jgi:transcriptional regulator with XRE-family HTH domain
MNTCPEGATTERAGNPVLVIGTPEIAMNDDIPTPLLAPGRPPGTSKRGREVAWTPPDGFGAELRALREAAGWSLRAAGERIGVSFSYLAKLEQGRITRSPERELIARLADLYGADASGLLRLAGAVPSTSLLMDMMRASGVSPEKLVAGLKTSELVPPMEMRAEGAFAKILRAFSVATGAPEPDETHFGAWQRDMVLALLRWATEDQSRDQVRRILDLEQLAEYSTVSTDRGELGEEP